MSELKCCPFCGGELEYSFLLGTSECKGCGVMIGFPKLTRHEDKIIATNKRNPMSNIVEKLEEREKYLENAMKESHANGHRFSEEKAMNERVAIRYAIKIVKQEIENGLE